MEPVQPNPEGKMEVKGNTGEIYAKEIGQPIQEPTRVENEVTLFSWKAPARPFKRRDKEFYITVIAIAGLVGIILFLVGGFIPVILIISIVFLFYVLNTVEPYIVNYSITNKGVKIANATTEWEMIRRFWITRRFDNALVIFETTTLTGRLELVINLSEIEEIRGVLSKYAIEEEAVPSFLDKSANWFSRKLPGNS